MKEFKVCPSSLKGGYSSYSPKAVRDMFGGNQVSPYLDFDIDEFRQVKEFVDAMHRISVSGVQEKFPAIIENGKIVISRADKRSTHILKPAPWDKTLINRKQLPANEHLTMQIASQVYDIETAENALCFTPSGQPVYITRRFDIMPDGFKLSMEDFGSLVGKNEQSAGSLFKYEGSYEDIAVAIRKYATAWMVEMERFFKLVVFNYIYANGDSHLKNFSLIHIGNDYRLSPAYDLLNTFLHIEGEDFGLNEGLSPNIDKSDVYEHSGHPCRTDFERFATRIGLSPKRSEAILNQFTAIPEKTLTLVSNSFLDTKFKRSYLRIISERTSRFLRPSN